MTRSFHAGRPFNTPTADIAAALEQVSIPTLVLSPVHLTGDPRYIRDFMRQEDKDRARAEALPVIADYRDRGCPVPDPLPDELAREMLDWAACGPVDADNLPLALEELDLQGTDPRRPVTLDPERAKDFHVIVIGCGRSGVLAGVRLKQADLPFRHR